MFELRFVVLDMSQAEESQLRLMEVAAMEPTPVAVAPFAYNILKWCITSTANTYSATWF